MGSSMLFCGKQHILRQMANFVVQCEDTRAAEYCWPCWMLMPYKIVGTVNQLHLQQKLSNCYQFYDVVIDN